MAAVKKKRRKARKTPATLDERSFQEIVSAVNEDGWIASGLTIDAETFQNIFSLRAAMRDAWRTNPYLGKYGELLAANIFGENGIMLRSKIKETEDRVVYAAGEKWALVQHERRINRLREWAEKKTGTRIECYRAFKLADGLERQNNGDVPTGMAMIQVGAPDVFANQCVELGWLDWQRAENCDVRGRRTYGMLRQIRLWSAARDGGHFIRLVKDTRVNKFGFAIQQVNDEWCDHFHNVTLDNGNVIRMGIEYPMTAWGIGKPLNYFFIKRIPRDWQTSARYGGNNSYALRDTVSADQIIHYARFNDTESTRPAPWGISILGKVRQLDQYEIASVVAARAEACKTGWLYSDLIPEGGVLPEQLPTHEGMQNAANRIKIAPGGMYGLPYGVKFQANNPTHPSGNFSNFRQGMGQATCAGLPGADYNVIFNDLNMSFSSGRMGRLDTNEVSKILQRWDIETAERPIFEAWLEMALITGAVPLPPQKFAKFNKPVFQGRRWAQIDETKAAQAAALRVANHMSSLGRENAELGFDFEEVMFERAEEIMLQESLGINPALTVQDAVSAPGNTADSQPEAELGEEAETTVPPVATPAAKQFRNGLTSHSTNGSRLNV